MEVYKVNFDNNVAISANPALDLNQGDFVLNANETVCWFAVNAANASEAISGANAIVGILWGDMANCHSL